MFWLDIGMAIELRGRRHRVCVCVCVYVCVCTEVATGSINHQVHMRKPIKGANVSLSDHVIDRRLAGCDV